MLSCEGFIDLARDKFDLENGFRLRDLSGLRSTTSNLYMTFLDEMAPAVVGRAKWDKSKHLVDIHSIITTSDEAFLLLCSENYINVWTNDDPEKVTTLCPMSSFCAYFLTLLYFHLEDSKAKIPYIEKQERCWPCYRVECCGV